MGIANVTGLAPLLQVFDMRKSMAWYHDVLGFEVLQTHEPDGHLYWAMLKLGDARLMLNAKYEDDKRPANAPRPADRSDFALYFGCQDVDAAYEELRPKINLEPPKTAYYGMRQLTITDPDGFVLVFQHPAKN
jgi:uncharacterized glyoxalase superfamily protein PhnB